MLTLGKEGSVIYTGGQGQIEVPPVRLVLHMDDPTGAGDAYRGGFFAGLNTGCRWDVCGRVGALCGAVCARAHRHDAHTTSRRLRFAHASEATFGAEPAAGGFAQAA